MAYVYNLVWTGAVWVPMLGSASGLATTLSEGQYNTPDIVLANLGTAPLQLTSAGFTRVAEQFSAGAEDNTNAILASVLKPLAVSTYCASVSTNLGAANAANVKASAGNVFSFSVQNTNANPRWLYLVNTAGTPTGASAAAVIPFLVPSNGQVTVGEDFFGTTGINFATGIGAAMMTTLAGGTLGTAGECFWTVRFK
jgi:hypothetical protein